MNLKLYLLYFRIGLGAIVIIVFCIMGIVAKVRKQTINTLQQEKATLIEENRRLFEHYNILLSIDKSYHSDIQKIEQNQKVIQNEAQKVYDANTEWAMCPVPNELQKILCTYSSTTNYSTSTVNETMRGR